MKELLKKWNRKELNKRILTGESTNGNLSEDEKNVIEAYKKIDEISKKNIRKILDLPEKSKDTNTESSTSKIG